MVVGGSVVGGVVVVGAAVVVGATVVGTGEGATVEAASGDVELPHAPSASTTPASATACDGVDQFNIMADKRSTMGRQPGRQRGTNDPSELRAQGDVCPSAAGSASRP